jgi:HK97 family phage major capsid protein
VASAEIRFKLIAALISGTGAGQPLGVLNAGCLVTVSKETGQTAQSVVVENLVNMWSRLTPESAQNAVWCINKDVEPQLFTMGITVGTGGSPIFMPAGGLSQSPYNTLLGRPIIPLEQCSTLGQVGDVILADWSQYVAIDRGLQTASLIHVKFVYDETALRFVYRFDGEPWPASAITPYSGSSNTLSPFVTLATRS